MTRRIVSTPGQSAPVVINLPMKTTDLNAHQTAQVSGGRSIRWVWIDPLIIFEDRNVVEVEFIPKPPENYPDPIDELVSV